MISNEYSVLSDLKWSKRRIGEHIHYPIDPKFGDVKEYWESEYPTRSDTRNIDNVEIINPIFGDSFMFCSGVPKQYDVATLLTNKYPKTLFLNLSLCGSGNSRIITRLEQWANDPLSKKTNTIILGLTSLYRFDYYMNVDNPSSLEPSNSVYDEDGIRGFNIMPQIEVNEMMTHLSDERRNKIKSSLQNIWESYIMHQSEYPNVYYKHLETTLKRIDWITKANNWNIIFVKNIAWEEPIHKNDIEVINKYLQDLNIENRKCSVIEIGKVQGTFVDALQCGHWGTETIKTLARLIAKDYDVF